MRYHYISDSHVHSDCSFDGTDPVMMICERAAALGLYSIAVTDHCECDIYYKEGFDRSVVQSFFETRKARAVFYGRLQVYAGIELGQPITDPKATREALSAGAFDFVLASVHNLPGQKDFYYLNYTDKNVDPLLSDYFDHVLQVAKWGQFDSLAHLTYPLRYILAQGGAVQIPRENRRCFAGADSAEKGFGGEYLRPSPADRRYSSRRWDRPPFLRAGRNLCDAGVGRSPLGGCVRRH